MAIKFFDKNQYLTEYAALLCEVYIKEWQFITHCKNLTRLQLTASRHTLARLNEIIEQSAPDMFFILENFLRHHIRYVLPKLEEMIHFLPGELQELNKMALRQKNILKDNLLPPHQQFNLSQEIKDYLPNAAVQMSSFQHARAAALLDSLISLTNAQTLHQLGAKGFNKPYGTLLYQLHKLKSIIQESNIEEINQLLQSHINFSDSIDFIFNFSNSLPHFAEKIIPLLKPLSLGNKISEKLQSISLSANHAFNHADTLIKKQARLATTVKKIHFDTLLLTLTDINLSRCNKKNWVDIFDIKQLQFFFPQADIYIDTKRNRSVLYLLGHHGSKIAKINFDEIKKKITMALITDHIIDDQDFIEAKQLIITLIAHLPTIYRCIIVNCQHAKTAIEICANLLKHKIQSIEISEKTNKKIQSDAKSEPDILKIFIEPETQYIFSQCQTLFDLGFIPELNESTEEVLRIQTIDKNQTINISCPCLNISIWQIMYCAHVGIGFTVKPSCQTAIRQYIKTKEHYYFIPTRALTAKNLFTSIQLLLKLGFIPEIKETNTKRQLEKAINDKWYTQGKLHSFIIDHPSVSIAYEQMINCLNINLMVALKTKVLANKINKFRAQNILSNKVTIDLSQPKVAIQYAQLTLNNGFLFQFSKSTKNRVINNILLNTPANQFPKLSNTQLTVADFTHTIENGLLIVLNKDSLKSLAQDIANNYPTTLPVIHFFEYPSFAHHLLIQQIEQIEKINQKLSVSFKFCCDSYTTENNFHAIEEYIQQELATVIDHCTCPQQLLTLQKNNQLNIKAKIESMLSAVISAIQSKPSNLQKPYQTTIKKLQVLQWKLNGLTFDVTKTLLKNTSIGQEPQFIKIAQDRAKEKEQQLFERAKALASAKPTIITHPIDPQVISKIQSSYYHHLPLQHAQYKELHLIQSDLALTKDQVNSLTEAATLERLQILGKRISSGLVLDHSLQEELKSLSLQMLKYGKSASLVTNGMLK